jgi:hypothetical protein
MSFVNSSLLNTGVVSSNLSSETIAAGESGDLNQEFSKMLQYLRQEQSGKEDYEPKHGVAKEGLSKEHSTNFEAPMKNLLGFLETFEGQVAKVSGPKSSEANAALAPVADKLASLAQFLSILQEKLNEGSGSPVEKVVMHADAGVDNLDLNELADELTQVRVVSDQLNDPSKLPIFRDKIKSLPVINSKNDVFKNGATLIAPDTSGLKR